MGSQQLSKQTRKIIFVVLGSVILYIYLNLSAPVKMDISRIPYDFINAIILLLYGRFQEISEHVLALLLDGILCVGGLFLWAAFFSQFVLPVRTLRERLDIPKLVLSSFGQDKGPAIFIENGKIKERLDETERRGEGVILLDSASAAALQKGGNFTRAVGPGLIFTGKNERIAKNKAVDLHEQERIIGPRYADIIFFDEESGDPLDHAPEEKFAREARRMQTSGLTRDGIEVVPNISISFRLKADKENKEGDSFFGYNPQSVEKAVLNEGIAITSDTEEQKLIPWDWLPAHLAADLWREYLRKFLLNQLFDIEELQAIEDDNINADSFDKTGLVRIIDMVKRRLTKSEVQALDDVGKIIPGKKIISKEYRLLENNGVIVTEVTINHLRTKSEKKLVDRWMATWLQQAYIQKSNIVKRNEQLRQIGENEALKTLGNSLIIPLYRDVGPPRNLEPGLSETLHELIRGTKTSIMREPNLNNIFAEEKDALERMIDWVKIKNNGT